MSAPSPCRSLPKVRARLSCCGPGPLDGSARARPNSPRDLRLRIDEQGTARDHIAQLQRIDLKVADPNNASQGVSFFGCAPGSSGKYTVKLMVRRQTRTNRVCQFLDVDCARARPPSDILLPPIFVDEPGAWLGLGLRSQQARLSLHHRGAAVRAATSFRVRNDTAGRLVLIRMRPTAPRTARSNLEIRSSVIDASGAQMPAGQIRFEKVLREPGGKRTYLSTSGPTACPRRVLASRWRRLIQFSDGVLRAASRRSRAARRHAVASNSRAVTR